MVLTMLPLWLSGLLLVGVPTALAMSGPILIRRYIDLARIRVNNEVAGFKFATVGVLYAVLLAFAVIVVWEKFSEAERLAANEAGAVATLFRLADGIGGETGTAIRENLSGYAATAIAEDWPAMERGRGSPAATRALDRAYAAVVAFSPADLRAAALLTESLRQLDLVTQARRARVITAGGTVPGILWLVLFGGAILTVTFTFFFGTQNLLVQTMMTGMLALLIFAGLLVIIAIDRPFAGSVKVQPEGLALVLEEFGQAKRP